MRIRPTGRAGRSRTYQQSSSGAPLWQHLAGGTQGVHGEPYLTLDGSQVAGEPVTLRLRDAAPGSLFLLWIATPASTPLSALGGTIHAAPPAFQALLATDDGGLFVATIPWPPGLPPGTHHVWQVLVADAANPHGLALSNAVKGTAP